MSNVDPKLAAEILGSQVRVRLLQELFERKGKRTYIAELARATGASWNDVAYNLAILAKHGIVRSSLEFAKVPASKGRVVHTFALNNSRLEDFVKAYFRLVEPIRKRVG